VAMATRSDALDPGLLVHLLREMPLSELDSALNHHSGLAGMSGTSGDIREVLLARAAGCPDAPLAVQVYLHRLRREIAAARTSLRRLDALILTGGVAEHQPELCAELLVGMDFLEAKSELVVVQAREDLEMAREVELVLAGGQQGGTNAHS
jgi:acetate kinase